MPCLCGDSIWLKGHEFWKADSMSPGGGLETRNGATVASRVGTRLPQTVAVGGEEDACSGHVKESAVTGDPTPTVLSPQGTHA